MWRDDTRNRQLQTSIHRCLFSALFLFDVPMWVYHHSMCRSTHPGAPLAGVRPGNRDVGCTGEHRRDETMYLGHGTYGGLSMRLNQCQMQHCAIDVCFCAAGNRRSRSRVLHFRGGKERRKCGVFNAGRTNRYRY